MTDSVSHPDGPPGAVPSGRDYAVALVFYSLSLVLTLAFLVLILKQPSRLVTTLIDPLVWLGALTTASLVAIRRRGLSENNLWQLLWVALAVFMLWNVFGQGVSLRQYGDAEYMKGLLLEGKVQQRWLAGSALLSWLSRLILGLPGSATDLLSRLASVTLLLKISSLLVMAGGSLWLLRRWPGRLSVLLSTLTPVWLLFSTGYIEYYPFIAPVLVATYAWLMDRPLSERSPLQIGFLAALLFPLLYYGYAPIALSVLVCFALARPARAATALGWSGLVALAGIAVFWPAGISNFFRLLYRAIPQGTDKLPYAPYRELAAGPESPLFTGSYVLSHEHLLEVLFMSVVGAGLFVLPLLVGAAVVAWRIGRAQLQEGWRRDGRLGLGLALALWPLPYIFWMIPRLGPVRDLDLFFTVYLTWAFFAGHLLDLVLSRRRSERFRVRLAILALTLGSTAVCAGRLIHLGIRVPP